MKLVACFQCNKIYSIFFLPGLLTFKVISTSRDIRHMRSDQLVERTVGDDFKGTIHQIATVLDSNILCDISHFCLGRENTVRELFALVWFFEKSLWLGM